MSSFKTPTSPVSVFLAPLAWLLGIPWNEAPLAGELLATKLFINELVAHLQLAAVEPGALSDKTRLILTYAGRIAEVVLE